MTYKEAIQIQIRALAIIYNNATLLMEVSTEEQQYPLKFLRDRIPQITGNLYSLVDMPDSLDRTLTGDYSINVNLCDI